MSRSEPGRRVARAGVGGTHVQPTPRILLAAQRDALEQHFGGIRNADPEAVHDARVASRRMRELLPLCVDQRDERYAEVRELGRRLGQVRDCDVEIGLLNEFEERVPRAGGLLAVRRHTTVLTRENRLRQVIKTLSDDAGQFAPVFPMPPAHAVQDRLWTAGWRERLRSRVNRRRERAVEALDCATGVYFPNRLHRARIAIKKLRYAAEVARETGLFTDTGRALRPIRRAQDLLGDIHDRELLRGFLTTQIDSRLDGDGASMLLPCVDYEIAWRHRRFLTRRTDLIEACQAIRLDRPQLRRIAASAASIGVATALLAISQGRR